MLPLLTLFSSSLADSHRKEEEEEKTKKYLFRRVFTIYFFRRELRWRCWTTAIKDRPISGKKGLEGVVEYVSFSKGRRNEREREREKVYLLLFLFLALWLVEIMVGGL